MIFHTDNDILAKVIGHLNTVLKAYPFPAALGKIVVQQKQQPTQQGIPAEATVYVERLFDHRYGFAYTSYKHVEGDPNHLQEIEVQVYETTLQISVLAIPNIKDLSVPTAADLASVICQILQRRSIIRAFAADDIGLLRVSDIRNLYFTDDRDRQENHPSFDLVLTYKRSIEPDNVPRVTSAEAGLYSI